MILHVERFLQQKRPQWEELSRMLDLLEKGALPPTLESVTRLHALYEYASADLAHLTTFAVVPEVQAHLESLVARAYAAVHDTERTRWSWSWLTAWVRAFPQAFRRHLRAFGLSLGITLIGVVFGMGAVAVDNEAKATLVPFSHLLGDPSERVAEEESRGTGEEAAYASFSAYLMTHNIRVSIFCFALGLTLGIGTGLLLFYNGTLLGAICFDYIRAGEGVFLTGWLLPHGSVEIPSIILAGQAGFILAGGILSLRRKTRLSEGLRAVRPDLVSLLVGLSVLLVWAGLVESFFSQTHEPVIPYSLKILVGTCQLLFLIAYLSRYGRSSEKILTNSEDSN